MQFFVGDHSFGLNTEAILYICPSVVFLWWLYRFS